MDVDLEELAAIVELLDKADFTEFRFDKGDLHILVRRGDVPAEPAPAPPAQGLPVQEPPVQEPAAKTAAMTAALARSAAPVPIPPPVAPGDETEEGTELVRSPMLGTFYRSPKPGEPPFIGVGDKVDPDSVVCIVEVMKLMNSVRAGLTGQVAKVFVTDGQLVEFEQPLFAVTVTP